MSKKNLGRSTQTPQKKFIADVDILISHNDKIVAGSVGVYVQDHSSRFEFARQQEKLENNEIEFAEYICRVVDENVHDVLLKVYQKPDGEHEKEAHEFKDRLDSLDLIQELDDIELVQFYSFSNEIYGDLTRAISQGVQPGKKLRKS